MLQCRWVRYPNSNRSLSLFKKGCQDLGGLFWVIEPAMSIYKGVKTLQRVAIDERSEMATSARVLAPCRCRSANGNFLRHTDPLMVIFLGWVVWLFFCCVLRVTRPPESMAKLSEAKRDRGEEPPSLRGGRGRNECAVRHRAG